MSDLEKSEARRKAQFERINELSQLARTAWFTLLAYLVFVGITLLGVKDADFFLPARQTRLPLVGVDIPTASFFWTAPVLGAALYTYLHLFLIKLWDAHDPPTRDADPTHHWLVNDFVLVRQGDPTARARPLSRLADLITRLLVWVAGPFVLAYAWWRSMPAHNEWMTLLIALCLGSTLYVGFTSWWRADQRLARPWRTPWGPWWQHPVAVVAAVLLLATSWLRTEGGLDDYFDGAWTLEDVTYRIPADTPVFRWWLTDDLVLPLARTDLSGVELVPLPDAWRTPETARSALREIWCRREGLPMEVCDQPVGPDHPVPDYVEADRQRWCREHGPLDGGACADRFAELDRRFADAWAEERESSRASLPALNLQRRDLRRASASNASLVGADLVGARLERADLSGARLEGADLAGAGLRSASLVVAQLEGVNLAGRLEGAELGLATLDRAALDEAGMEGADLFRASLVGVILRWARLEGANLFEARLEGADLRWADLRKLNWTGASIRASVVQSADFRGSQGLTQAQLEEVIGDESTLLPEGTSDAGVPLYVWSCWATPPPDLDRIVATAAGYLAPDAVRAAQRAEFVCGPDNPRRKTGTPLALDAPYPAGHPLADRD